MENVHGSYQLKNANSYPSGTSAYTVVYCIDADALDAKLLYI